AQLQRPLQTAAVRVEAVPGDAGAVVETDTAEVVQEIDQGAGQQGVLKRDIAVGAGTDDTDRTRLVPQLFADGAVVDEGGYQGAGGARTAEQGARAVGRGQHQGDAAAGARCEAARRVAQVKAWDRQSAAFAGQQHPPGQHRARQRPGFVDLGT